MCRKHLPQTITHKPTDMNHNANLPAGSETDSRAPWNQSERHLCTFCDKDEINELWWKMEDKMSDERADEDGEIPEQYWKEIQDAEDNFRSQFRACKNCEA
jgi:hypothetical protein